MSGPLPKLGDPRSPGIGLCPGHPLAMLSPMKPQEKNQYNACFAFMHVCVCVWEIYFPIDLSPEDLGNCSSMLVMRQAFTVTLENISQYRKVALSCPWGLGPAFHTLRQLR